jgi:heme-binding NEAT domain protein
MKQLLFISLISFPVLANAQQFGQVSFKDNTNTVAFTVPKESNVRYYVLEGSNNEVDFDIVSRVESQGNRVLPCQYQLPQTDKAYTSYRIRQVDMNGAITYSPILNRTTSRFQEPIAAIRSSQ